MSPGISIIICTHNGEALISDVLAGIKDNAVDFAVEIILVDNASTDSVAERAQIYWTRMASAFSLKVVREQRLGKSFAFFTGVSHANFDLIVMCDDDNILAPDYLATARKLMQDREIGALGGAGTLRTNGTLPPHFLNYAPWFAVGAQIASPKDAELDMVELTTPERALWGAGLVVRRIDMITLARINGFPLLNGQAKCEDYELCHAIALMGKKLVYTPNLKFFHCISIERLAPSRIERRAHNGKEAAPILSSYQELRRNLLEPLQRTIGFFPWRMARALFNLSGGRAVLFGFLSRCRLRMFMKPIERQVYDIALSLRAVARSACRSDLRGTNKQISVG